MLVLVKKSFFVIGQPVQHAGDIVELDDEHAKVLIKNKIVEEIKLEPTEEVVVEETSTYEELSVTELKDLLKEHGLSTKGKKSELIKRLRESDNQ